MNLTNFKNGGINVTGFQLLNYTKLNSDETQDSYKPDNEWKKWRWPSIDEPKKLFVSLLIKQIYKS